MKRVVGLMTVSFVICIASNAWGLTIMNLTQWRVEDGGNDHWYAIVTDRMVWQEASNQATNISINTSFGYLASITTQWENDFIFSSILGGIDDPLYSNQDQFLTGGYWSGSSWMWSSGESYGYTNWSIGEPNNPSETVISMWGEDASANRVPGRWNDTRNNLGLFSIFEWGDPSASPSGPPGAITSVPEPSSLALFFAGIGLAVTWKKIKR